MGAELGDLLANYKRGLSDLKDGFASLNNALPIGGTGAKRIGTESAAPFDSGSVPY